MDKPTAARSERTAQAGAAPASDHAAATAATSTQTLARLFELLAKPQNAEPIKYGHVRYDGVLYVVGREPSGDDADVLYRQLADCSGDSRYATLGEPTWYGALDPFTAIAEAAYHALCRPPTDAADTLGALYRLRVRGRFADLHGRERFQPVIVGDSYVATQALAREVRARAALSGVLYPSARSSGTCLAVFARCALRGAQRLDALPMRRVSPSCLKVRAPWSRTWWKLRLEDLRRNVGAKLECA
ncbi:MAG TPA: RES family NAD+ phosphorylase [Dokdonella sp.]